MRPTHAHGLLSFFFYNYYYYQHPSQSSVVGNKFKKNYA